MEVFRDDILSNAKVLWEFMNINDPLAGADCILALGSNDVRVAARAAEIFLYGYAPVIVFSGGLGRLTEGVWVEPEAVKFANTAKELGVPEEKILIESRSTNTGENIRFSKQLMEEKGIFPESIILVQKPYMQKRALATFLKNWPGKTIISTAPQISFEEYCTEEIPMELLINILVGDFQRIMVYPTKGFQAELPVTFEAKEAFDYLKKEGFTNHLI